MIIKNRVISGLLDIYDVQDYVRMLEEIVEFSSDGFYITNSEANTIYMNKSYERITGLRREDLICRNMGDLVDSGIISEATSFRVLKDKKPVTINQTFNTGKRALVVSTPFLDKNNDILMIVTKVRDITELKLLEQKYKKSTDENIKYKSLIEELKLQDASSDYIVAEDESMRNLLLMAKRVARVDTTIIIYGETGTGKELIAKYIYNNSNRANKPFVKINCGAIPESLIESEFFGYTEGSFTGAVKGGKSGIFEAANDGTLFLDEIGELPLNMQVKLLRVLQDGEVMRIGSNKSINVDVRVIAATNRDLEDLVKKGRFREDLYYRLNVVPLIVKPLRERRLSIIPTAEYLLKVYNEKYKLNKIISKEAYKYFYDYNWPGNVRELSNLVERLVVTSSNDEISVNNIPEQLIEEVMIDSAKKDASKLKDVLNGIEKSMIINAYNRHGNVRDAAKELGIDASTFVRKRKKYV